MKKKIVWFLCKIGLSKLAFRISPSLTWGYFGKKLVEEMRKNWER